MKAAPMPSFDKKDIDDNKVIAALSYIGILCLVPLLAKKDSKFAQEHGKQGLIMLVAWIIGSFVFWIPLVGWLLLLVMFLADLYAFIKCLQGEFWEVPLLGQFRKKINL
jgi:uncharacterized membrane protein